MRNADQSLELHRGLTLVLLMKADAGERRVLRPRGARVRWLVQQRQLVQRDVPARFGIPMAVGGAAFFGIGLWFVLSHTTVQDDNGQTIARRPLKLPAGLALGPEGLVV